MNPNGLLIRYIYNRKEKGSGSEADIYFFCGINEKAFDEVKQEVRKHVLSSFMMW